MKKLSKIFLSLGCLAACIPCGGCSGCNIIKTTSNEAYFYYADFEESTRGFVFEKYDISVEEKKVYDYSDEPSYGINTENYLNGGTQKADKLVIPEGFEGIRSYITNFGDYVNACGYVRDGKLYGFLNRFLVDGGVRFGDGQTYCVEDIDYSVVFIYDPDAEQSSDKVLELTEEEDLEGCNAVAIKDNVLIYWKENKYYSYDLTAGVETYLVDDKAYNDGVLDESFTVIGTNGDYTVIHMHTTVSEAEYDYFYLYEYSTLTFSTLTKV